MRTKRFVSQALAVAKQSECRYTVGALLVRGERIMAASANRWRNDPEFVPYLHCSYHAETSVLKLIDPHMAKGATVVVARINKSGKACMAKPCPRCMRAMTKAGISKVIYTNRIGIASTERLM